MLEILLVDDEPDILEPIRDLLIDRGHHVTTASDGLEAMACFEDKTFDLLISDIRMPRMDGLALLRRVQRRAPTTKVILTTAYGTIPQAVEAIQHQAVAYFQKPFDLAAFLRAIDRLAERTEIEMVGTSPAMARVRQHIERVARSSGSVLIEGDTGTGKELVARLIHASSARRDRRLVAVNCAGLPDGLLEAELFGHERGAFTDAVRRREGRFGWADGGTLLLDEIGEMSLVAQAKLLRVLEEGSFEPLGSNDAVRADVRVVCASNRDLAQLVAQGRFRKDLYYRVRVFHLRVPALTERRGDIPLLLEHFCRKLRSGGDLPGFSPTAWAALLAHDYPGNVRELRHVVEHALAYAQGDQIELGDLPAEVGAGSGGAALATGSGVSTVAEVAAGAGATRPLAEAVRDFERDYVERAVAETGSKTRAAEKLGISRKTLWTKIRDS